MSNVLMFKVTTTTQKAVSIPAYFADEYGSYVAIVSFDMSISIFPREKAASISINNPEFLSNRIERLKEIEESEFWQKYDEAFKMIQQTITPYNKHS